MNSPNNVDNYINNAAYYYRIGRTEAALEVLFKGQQEFPEHAQRIAVMADQICQGTFHGENERRGATQFIELKPSAMLSTPSPKPPMLEKSQLTQTSAPVPVSPDPIDALLRKFIRDSMTNRFWGEMDGLKKHKNLLVIGVTNRKNEIDPAALRHGRFGVHITIPPLPDAKDRKSIFEIFTKKVAAEGLLDESVDLGALAAKTEKYSGADIKGLVEEASQISLERLNGIEGSKETLQDYKDGKITMADFEKAIEEHNKKKLTCP